MKPRYLYPSDYYADPSASSSSILPMTGRLVLLSTMTADISR